MTDGHECMNLTRPMMLSSPLLAIPLRPGFVHALDGVLVLRWAYNFSPRAPPCAE